MYAMRRDPALFVSLAATLIRIVAAFWIDLTIEQPAAHNAVVAAAAGLLVAGTVRDGLPAAILGMVQAVIALAVGFGLRLDAETQGLIMSAIGTTIAAYVRTQVHAPAPPRV